MDEVRFLEQLAPLGIGGLLAWGMFVLYRRDSREMAAKWEGQSSALIAVVKENTAAITTLIEIVRELQRQK